MGNVRLMGEYEISLSDFIRKVRNSLKKDSEVTDVTGLKVATTESKMEGGETGKGRLNCNLTLAGRKKGVVFVSDIAFSLLDCTIIGGSSSSSSSMKLTRRLGTGSESEGVDEGERILVSDFIVGVVTTVLGTDVTSKAYERWLAGNEVKDREQVKENETPRLRRNLRQRAQRDGNMGGKQVLSREDAAVTLQAAWRSKWVRRCTRRKDVCAVAIQRIARGYLQRLRCGSDLVRAKDRRKEEIERLARLRRIRAKERELALLRKVPVASYLTMEKLRQDCSAKVLQRAFRSHLKNTNRVHLIPEKKGSQYRATYLSGMLGGIGKQGGLAEAKKEAARKALRKEGASGLFGAPSDENSAKKVLEENALSEVIPTLIFV
jgi:IQ calmodulin-binding motif